MRGQSFSCRNGPLPADRGHEMLTLPWSARGSLPPTYACFVTVTQQRLRRHRHLPAHLRRLRAQRRRLREADGLLGFAFAARLRDLTFWTIAAWVEPDAATLFAKAHTPSQQACAAQLAASAGVSWTCLVEELPISWPEARHRLAAHPTPV
jgi:hypothetical protein